MLARLEEYFLPHYSYEDYKKWEGDWELIKGVPYAMAPSPSIEHQEINLNIGVALKRALKNCKKCKALPEIDYKIDNQTVLRPDTLVVCNIEKSKPFVDKTPEIVFEVLSPSTKTKDRNLKYILYANAGVKYYVLVDPSANMAEIYELENKKYKLKAELKEGSFNFNLSECEIEFNFDEIFEE